MDILDKKHKFDLPEGILDEEFHTIWHRLEHAKKDNKLDDDDKNLSDEELKKRYKKISARRVKLALLIQFIAKEEKISISVPKGNVLGKQFVTKSNFLVKYLVIAMSINSGSIKGLSHVILTITSSNFSLAHW